jgi:thiamine-phosphate pyrophosphorylase
MATRPKVEARPAPRLYLATPPVSDPQALIPVLTEIIAVADIAAILVRLAPADERSLVKRIKALAPAIQNAGIALLLDGHPECVARSGADGAHLAGIEAFKAAAGSLKPASIAGAGGLRTRHDAMIAGETGADYVLFGEPDSAGRRPARDAVVERVAWWAELFEPSCAGYAAALADVHILAAAGADFVLVDDCIWNDPRGPLAAVREASEAIRLTGSPPKDASPA